MKKAFLMTAKKVGESCVYYKAELLIPTKSAKEKKHEGALPVGDKEKGKFISGLVKWLRVNSLITELFNLVLSDKEITDQDCSAPKFAYYNSTGSWVLNLTAKEFKELQKLWKENKLPEDLFYKAGAEIKIIEPLGFFGRFLTTMGFTIENLKIYSPRQWKIKELYKK